MSWLRKVLVRTAPDTTRAQTPDAPAVDAAAALRQGNAHLEAGRLDDAANSYRLALTLDRSSVAARVNLAFAMLSAGQSAQAVPLLVEAIALAPDNADAHFMLGNEYLQQRQTQKARDCLARAVELQPSLAWAYPPLCRATFE